VTVINANTFLGGVVRNNKLVPSVSANDLILSLKTLAGTDPSATDPVYVRIGDTVRSVTAALSVTKADATNWANLGSTELATKEVDLFAYLVWNTNLTPDAVDIFWSRIPYGRLYSDFSATTTNEKYAAINATAPAATDECVNIGRFAATLSAGAGYTWTVPTFTNINLIQHPIYETRLLSYAPVFTGFSSGPTVAARYQIAGIKMYIDTVTTAVGASDAGTGTAFTQTIPFASLNVSGGILYTTYDNSANKASGLYVTAAGSRTLTLYNSASTAWTAANNKAASFNGWIWI